MASSYANTALDHRKRRILYALITEYIGTGEPVGSRRLAKRYGLNLSAASIRNVLADLEEEGFLTQPHTSAGRVPTDMAFRTFVDALIRVRDVGKEQKDEIRGRMNNLQPGREAMLREAGRLLSTLTGAAALISAPKPETEKLSQLRFLPVRQGVLLVVIITRSGAVQNRLVEVNGETDLSELERLNNYLATVVEDLTLLQIREALAAEVEGLGGLVPRTDSKRVQASAHAILEAMKDQQEDQGQHKVIIEGEELLFDGPDFEDAGKIRAYLRTFQDKERLLSLLDQAMLAGGVQVLIGSETNLSGVDDISLVTAGYQGADHAMGTLGVIGPVRMDYAKIVPIVGFTAQVMSALFDESASIDGDDAANDTGTSHASQQLED